MFLRRLLMIILFILFIGFIAHVCFSIYYIINQPAKQELPHEPITTTLIYQNKNYKGLVTKDFSFAVIDYQYDHFFVIPNKYWPTTVELKPFKEEQNLILIRVVIKNESSDWQVPYLHQFILHGSKIYHYNARVYNSLREHKDVNDELSGLNPSEQMILIIPFDIDPTENINQLSIGYDEPLFVEGFSLSIK